LMPVFWVFIRNTFRRSVYRRRFKSLREPVVLSRELDELPGCDVRRRGLRHFPEGRGTLPVMGGLLEPDEQMF
jgi:hypothetical protein